MLIIMNKLIILSNEDFDIINGINNLIRNKDGQIDFTIITKIPKEIINFENKYGLRFESTISEIVSLKRNEEEEEIEEVLEDCKGFMSNEEFNWLLKAIDLKYKYGDYQSESYYKNNVGVNHNFLYWDEQLPANNTKQFSFYSQVNAPIKWVERLSSIFESVEFEFHYKERSMLKYNKLRFKGGRYKVIK